MSRGEGEHWARRLAADPGNRLYSRMNRRRLDGESLRDTLLTLSGRVTQRAGGPGVRPPLPREITSTLLKNQWLVSTDEKDHHRRSVYLFARRNLRYPLFELFDRPDGTASCAHRKESTTAPQSLILLNSGFSLTMAKSLAGRCQAGAAPAGGVRPANVQPAVPSVNQAGRRCAWPGSSSPGQAAAVLNHSAQLALALINLNEFLFVD